MIKLCAHCGQHHISGDSCVHPSLLGARRAGHLALLLGLTACTPKFSDPSEPSEPSEPSITEPGEPATEPSQPDNNEPSDSAVAPAYGVPMVDNDGDGVDADSDCIDEDPYTYPYAARYEENPELCRTDKDQDGWGSMTPAAGVEPGTDCNDGDANVYPGAPETAGDGIDSDCDGVD